MQFEQIQRRERPGPGWKDPYGWYDVSIRKPEEGEEVIFMTAYREYLRGFYEDGFFTFHDEPVKNVIKWLYIE